MSSPGLHFGLTFLLIGLVLIAVSIPLIRGAIRPNGWYGIRIPSAFESDEAWYRINKHGGKCFVGFGVALVICGLLNLLLLPREIPYALWIVESMLPLILLVPTVFCVFRYPRQPQ